MSAGLDCEKSFGPHTTLAELQAVWPSTPYTLFSRFGIGSRDKLGFRPDQTLGDVCRRYLIFDCQPVLSTLAKTEEEHSSLYHEAPDSDWLWVDARGADEHALGCLPHWHYLDRELASQLMKSQSTRPVVFFCRLGPLGAAAAAHFRSKGLSNIWALRGGLQGWSEKHLPAYPIYGESTLRPGRIHLLAYRRRAAFLLASPPHPNQDHSAKWTSSGCRYLFERRDWPFGPARLWAQGDRLIIERDHQEGWLDVAPQLLDFLHTHQWSTEPGHAVPLPQLGPRIEEFLGEVVQPTLMTHKGTIELREYQDGWAKLALGGGCQGCSSAAITVNEEIARMLLEQFEELLGVEDVSEHSAESVSPPY